jgi:hypothetical protein
MKIPLALGLGLSLFVMAGCATNPPSVSYTPPSTATAPATNLLVISAVYGSGTRFADVTYRVDNYLHQPSVQFFARPEWLQADPNPGWNKALIIVYEWKGQRHIFATGEGGKVNLDLLIEQAKRKSGKDRK